MRRPRLVMAVSVLVVAALAALALLVESQDAARVGFIYPSSGPFAQPGFDMRDGFLLHWSQVGNKAGGRSTSGSRTRRTARRTRG